MKLSIGMMVKNEAANLERCLEALQPLRDAVDSELIIVDTGSEDTTVAIAKRYTERVYFHAWSHDFAAMRNITIGYATGEWFLVVDADEVLEHTEAIVRFLQSKDSKTVQAAALLARNYTDTDDPSRFSALISLRLFRRTENFHYTGAIHNQAVFDGPATTLQAIIHHYGYMANDKELMERKFVRTSTILQNELTKDPEHIYYLYQLSVTYGMHNDYQDAIACIEKAYAVFRKLGRQKSQMFVLTHRALMYQIVRDYHKVEEVCLDALQVSGNYIDIYYYLAEAQAMQGKAADAIVHYEAYLAMLDHYDERPDKDAAVIDYTVGNAQAAYFNLSRLYQHTGEYARALAYAEKLTGDKAVGENLKNIVDLYLRLGEYAALRQYRRRVGSAAGLAAFYEAIEELTPTCSQAGQLALAQAFGDLEDDYGLMSVLRLDRQQAAIADSTRARLQQLDFSRLPVYCADVLYYLLQLQVPLFLWADCWEGAWLDRLFERCAKRHDDLGRQLYEFLQHIHGGDTLSDYKFIRTFCRYALLGDQLSDEQYLPVLVKYLDAGVAYMQTIYASVVLTEELTAEVKNPEEIFFVHMYSAYCYREQDQRRYVRCLRAAVQAFPLMKRGIALLLSALPPEAVTGLEQEEAQEQLAGYANNVKQQIAALINAGHFAAAKQTLKAYEELMPEDRELVAMQAVLAIKEGRLNEAQVILEQGLAVQPLDFSLQYNLAYLAERRQDYAQAVRLYRRLSQGDYSQPQQQLVQAALNKLTPGQPRDADGFTAAAGSDGATGLEQRKQSIRAMIDRREFDKALAAIAGYEALAPHDMEILLLKSQVLLKA